MNIYTNVARATCTEQSMKKLSAEVVVCGASLGGTLAAFSSAKCGKKTILLEKTDWIGGQLTSQAVPPDEHPWIEEQGCTASYRAYREKIRDFYRNLDGFSPEVKKLRAFCPADSEVSYISHPPKLALSALNEMLAPFVQNGTLKVVYNAEIQSCKSSDDMISSVTCSVGGEPIEVVGKIFLDGTDTGELIALCGAEYRVGAESRSETGEKHAPEIAMPQDMQPATYTASLENRKKGDFVITKPPMYDDFVRLKMPYDDFPVFSMYGPDSSTGKAKRFGMFLGEKDRNGEELFPLFKYRRIVCADYFADGSQPFDVTLVNWPQNDYFLGNLFESENVAENNFLARQFTLSFVYWLQTEAPRPDGKKGYPFFRLATEYLGTTDGLSKCPYIRESRRIKAKFTVTESDVAKGGNPIFDDSVGVGSYPIDLHITTQTHTFFYEPSERFTIPLGAMIPERMQNLLPACKNIGTTHLTNGCYRLHPVEWNVGEVAGLLAAFALDSNTIASEVWRNKRLFGQFCQLLEANGIQRYWKNL